MERIQSIIVPTDFSPHAAAAAVRAASLAHLDGAAIHLVHALGFPMVATPYPASLPPAVWQDLRQVVQEKIEEVRKQTEQRSGQTVTAEVIDSHDPVSAISDAVAAHHADLVVMGTHGYGGLRHAFLGSVTERALRTLETPLLAVREDLEAASQPIRKILVALDFSPHSERAAEVAANLAKPLSASVELLHVFDFPYGYNPYLSALDSEIQNELEANVLEQLDRMRVRLEERAVMVAVELRRGDPPTVIADTAREIGCQLIVMGTRGLRGLDHVLLGSVAERTMRAASCSVLTVKADSGGEAAEG